MGEETTRRFREQPELHQLWTMLQREGREESYRSALHLIGLLFLKYLSDQSATLDGDAYVSGDLQLAVPEPARWEQVSSDPTGSALLGAVEAFEAHPANQRLGSALTDLGLPGLASSPELYQRLVSLVSNNRLVAAGGEDLSVTIDRLLERAMREAGWRGGEHYTPSSLSLLLMDLLNPKPECTIYDPACGTGSLLSTAFRQTAQGENADANRPRLFGQEINSETAALAKISMVLRGVASASIEVGDTLLEPRFLIGSTVQQFDYVITNSPFNLDLNKQYLRHLENDPYGRFPFGLSRRRGDFLFVQHVVASLNDTGRAVMLISPSALSTSGDGERIRRALIEADLVESVIGLPSDMLRNTRIPGAILILNKAKPARLKGKVLFVYAEQEYERGRLTRQISEQQRNRIIQSVLEQRQHPGFATVAPLDEIRNFNYRLDPARYTVLIELETFLGGLANWEKLSEIADVLRGTRSGRLHEKEGGTPVIQGRDLTAPRLTIDDLTKVEVSEGVQTAIYSEPNDILIQGIGLRPRTYLVDEELAGALVSQHVYIVRLKEPYRYLARYLVEFFDSGTGQSLLSLHTRGVGAPTLSFAELRDMSVPIADDNIIELINELHQVEQNLFDRVSQARDIRQRLFSLKEPEQVNDQLLTLGTEAQVLAGSLVQIEDLDFQIRNVYPYPLAYAYRTLSAIMEPTLLYSEQLRVAENILAFLGTIGLALAARTGRLYSPNDSSLTLSELEDYWHHGISPGDWQSLGRRSGSVLRGDDQHPLIGRFASLWFKGRGTRESDFAKTLRDLGMRLNAFKHHRGPKTPHDFQQGTRELQVAIDKVLKELSVFVRYPMRLVQEVDIEWQTNKAVLNTLLYTGDHPGLRQEQVVTSQPLPKDKLYLQLSEDLWVPLYPLVTVDYCTQCGARETYLIDLWERQRSAIRLKSFERGHVHHSDTAVTSTTADLEHWVRANFGPS